MQSVLREAQAAWWLSQAQEVSFGFLDSEALGVLVMFDNQHCRIKTRICSTCQCPWCELSHHGQLQAPKMKLPNRVGRCAPTVAHWYVLE